ncbi:hypothetical protein [Legionella cardiaca]|uniref:Uncharacterized protein n=1 Tax=Legionella cardiaca TaxID=1071983 RepID=A0ABY8ATB3_9GAMM|nr:hypothetical protein [Legionella cardiaca]WED42382.1 hypothetical protein PXX05_10680 [Legionella cardiaca]
MRQRLPLVFSGIIFILFALLHVLRLIFRWEIVIAGHTIPMSVSIVALVVAILLSLWMFAASKLE